MGEGSLPVARNELPPPVQTDWRVITGPPCSGKTTLIRALEARGFPVVHEAARAWIEAQLACGRSLAAIRHDAARFEGRILQRKAHIEAELAPDRLIFFDRALPDSIAYFTAANLDAGPARRCSLQRRYRRVYFCQPVGAERFRDGVRAESAAVADALGGLLRSAYEGLGYRLIDLPPRPVSERLALILADLGASPQPPDRA
jgi:predicted ATPase